MLQLVFLLTNCKNCGNEVNKKAVICPSCGCKIKKPIFKKWWFWVIIVILVILIGFPSGENDNSVASDSPQINEVANEQAKELTREEYIEACETIDFETLSRNPDKYEGKKYGFTGEIIQVQESSYGNTVTLRINITKKTYEYSYETYYTDTILATVNIPKGDDRLLENDIINFWGECAGSYTYEAVLGNSVTLPKIEIKYFELIS